MRLFFCPSAGTAAAAARRTSSLLLPPRQRRVRARATTPRKVVQILLLSFLVAHTTTTTATATTTTTRSNSAAATASAVAASAFIHQPNGLTSSSFLTRRHRHCYRSQTSSVSSASVANNKNNNHIIDSSSSYLSSLPLDDLLFAAMNLLDSSPPSSPVPLLPSTSKPNSNQSSPILLFPGARNNMFSHLILLPPVQQLPPLPPPNLLLLPPLLSLWENSKNMLFYPQQYTYENENAAQPISRTMFLTPEEHELLQIIQRVRDEYYRNSGKTVTIRIAGGWVRDKLLLLPNTCTSGRDIDFVLDNISGVEFARLFQEYVSTMSKKKTKTTTIDDNDNNEEEEKCSAVPSSNTAATRTTATQSSTSAVVADQASIKEYIGSKSQHLQTANIKYKNFDIDFCQLRYEKYSKNKKKGQTSSRVPEETGMARAVEDAWRRDLTINSLYFNLNTNQVEDWTERGLQDLQLRNIATPMSPLPTLLQDPLRILRAIRFAAQLSFSMDPGLKRAAMDVRVRDSLMQKVSKDRMGNEIDTMFRTRDPVRGVALLLETGLVDVIFPLLPVDNVDDDDNNNTESLRIKLKESPSSIYKSAYQVLSQTQTLASRIFVRPGQWDESKRRFLWYAAFFKPFCDATAASSNTGGGGKWTGKRSRLDGSILYQLLTKGLKRPVSDIEAIESIIRGVAALESFLLVNQDADAMPFLFESEGIRFRNLPKHDRMWKPIADFRWQAYKVLKRIGPFWKESLLLTLAVAASGQQVDLSKAVERYGQWVTVLEDRLGLHHSMLFDKKYSKSMLNGSQIQELALPSLCGEDFRHVMEAQEEWQVRHDCWPSSRWEANRQQQNQRRNMVEEKEAALIDHLVRTFPQYAA